jgi:hypothetical protein
MPLDICHPTAPHTKLKLPEWYVSSLMMDRALDAIMRRVKKLDRKHDIPYLAGYSLDGKTIYIDRHMPNSFKFRGRTIETDRFLILHEEVEKTLIDQLGLHYLHAHQIATRAEDAAGTGELTKFARIDASDGQASCEQSSDDAALVAAARLDPDCGDRQSMQPLDQLGPPGGVVIHRKALPVRQHLDVQTLLRYVNSTVAMLCHLRAPSLLMRARALATVREWKKRLEHQAHSRSKSRGGCGLPVATGAVS